MAQFRTSLAEALNALAQAGRVAINETRTMLLIYQLRGQEALDIIKWLEPADFTLESLRDQGGSVSLQDLDPDLEGVELVALKPSVPDGVMPILTSKGFTDSLEKVDIEQIVWLEGLQTCVETHAVCYAPWGAEVTFQAAEPLPDPNRPVRVLQGGRRCQPLDRWLLRNPDADVSDPVLSPWRERAAYALSRAITQEVEPDGTLLFRGPPPTRFRSARFDHITEASFAALQRSAAWVYENPRELESRHGLFAAEVARNAIRDGDAADLSGTLVHALEGARIAYGFGVSQQSRDALKALSDLRKAVSDETMKLAETTRSLVAALTTATVGNAGILVARLTLGKDSAFVSSAAALLAVALALYVGVVIYSGSQFLSIQQSLRVNWRDRLYRYLGEAEYQAMVTDPVGRAEANFRHAAICCGLITALMLIAVLLVLRFQTHV